MLTANPDVEIVEQSENIVIAGDAGLGIEEVVNFDIKTRVRKKSGRIRVDNVPPEEFLVNRRAKSLDDARFICHRTTMSVSELVSMGYDQDEIETYAGVGELETENERRNRFSDLGDSADLNYADPSQKEVPVYESIITVSYTHLRAHET